MTEREELDTITQSIATASLKSWQRISSSRGRFNCVHCYGTGQHRDRFKLDTRPIHGNCTHCGGTGWAALGKA